MRKNILLLFTLALLGAGCASLRNTAPTGPITVGFYNMENLFDTEDDPEIDDQEYLATSELKWDVARYQTKLNNLGKVIRQMGDEDGPELLGACEIENRKVLEDLIQTKELKDRNYSIVHFNSPDARGIDVALLYKAAVFRPVSSRLLQIQFEDPKFRTRLPLLVTGIWEGKDTVSVIVNHWPSRRGGAEASEAKRIAVARRVSSYMDSVNRCCPSRHVIIMGDFNDEPTNRSISEVLQAGDLASAQGVVVLQNAFYQLKQQGQGSHVFNNEKSMLDQIILTPNFLDKQGLELIPGSATIVNPEWMQDKGKYAGSPLRTYAGKKYLGGYSDHFPVYIRIQMNPRTKKAKAE